MQKKGQKCLLNLKIHAKKGEKGKKIMQKKYTRIGKFW